MHKNNLNISVLVPIYNSGKTIHTIVDKLIVVLEENTSDYEIILIDDNSKDNSWEKIIEVCRKTPKTQGFLLNQNRGLMVSTVCGVENSNFEYIITIDDDLQYRPEDIPLLINKLEITDADIVFGNPNNRKHGTGHRLSGKIVMFLFDYLLMIRYRKVKYYTTFRLFKKDLFMSIYKGNNRCKNLFFLWEIEPKSMKHVDVVHQKRMVGMSNISLPYLIKYFKPQILVFSKKLNVFLLLLNLIVGVLLLSTASTLFLLFTTTILSILYLVLRSALLKEKYFDYKIKETCANEVQ